VQVTTASGALFRAAYAIIAMPPVAAGRLDFDPPLPLDRQELQQRMPMGRYYKVIVTYDKPFWRDAGYTGEVASVRGPVTATFDDDPGDGSGALLNFIGGDHALQWRKLSPDKQKDAVLNCLARWFGDAARRPTAYGYNPWADQPETGGAPVAIMAPGVLSRLGPALRAPCGRIHWAGTEAAMKWTGYMDGAIRAGEAAAVSVGV
jgi:monoamine oxidase